MFETKEVVFFHFVCNDNNYENKQIDPQQYTDTIMKTDTSIGNDIINNSMHS